MADLTINPAQQNASNELIEPLKPAKRHKTSHKLLIKAFPAEYIKQGLNGTKAYKAIKKNVSLRSARAEAPAILALPSVQKAIEALLPSEERTMQVLRDVYEAERENKITYKDLHKYWETDLRLRGKLKEGNAGTNVQVNMVIDNK